MPRTPRLVLKRRDPADSIGECGQSGMRPVQRTVPYESGAPRHIVPRRGYMMSFEEFDTIRVYDQRCGKDETVMLSVVRDRRRLIEFAEQLLERIRELEGKTQH